MTPTIPHQPDVRPSSISSDPPLLGRETKTLYLGHDVEVHSAPDIVAVGGLGPCLGVIVYEPKGKRAVVAHFGPFGGMPLEVQMLKEAVQREFHLPRQLQVYLGGAQVCLEIAGTKEETLTLENREKLVDLFKELGVPPGAIFSRWCKSDNTASQDMIIDLTSGEVNYAEYDI